jgi:hypothetical protein
MKVATTRLLADRHEVDLGFRPQLADVKGAFRRMHAVKLQPARQLDAGLAPGLRARTRAYSLRRRGPLSNSIMPAVPTDRRDARRKIQTSLRAAGPQWPSQPTVAAWAAAAIATFSTRKDRFLGRKSYTGGARGNDTFPPLRPDSRSEASQISGAPRQPFMASRAAEPVRENAYGNAS